MTLLPEYRDQLHHAATRRARRPRLSHNRGTRTQRGLRGVGIGPAVRSVFGVTAGRRGRLGGVLGVAASVLVVLLIAGGALLALHGSAGRLGAARRSDAVSVWARRLAVIARPQTRADQVALYRDGNDLPYGVVAPGSVRFTGRTPWGGVVLVGVAVRGQSAGQLVISTAGGNVPTGNSPNTIFLTRLGFARGRSIVISPTRKVGLVRIVMPMTDGVAKVRISVGRVSRTVPVIGNVVAAQLPSAFNFRSTQILVTAYAPNGSIVRRFNSAPVLMVAGDKSTDNFSQGGS